MIYFKLKNDTGLPTAEAINRLCEALVGSPGFINNEIVVSDSELDQSTGKITVHRDDTLRVIIGNDNGHDIDVEGTVSSII